MGVGNFLKGLPVIGGLFDNSEQDAMDQLAENKRLYGDLQAPELNWDTYNPEQYGSVGDYKPEDYSYQTVSEDPSIRSAQMAALNKMSGLADTGLSDVDQQGYQKAREIAAQTARSGSQAAIQNAAARGVGGSGLEFAMREIANQEGSKRAQDAGLAQASDSARMRAMYQQAYGDALGKQRSQDYQVNSGNTDIINKFNQLNTQGANQAQQLNLQNRQSIANQNTQSNNQAQQYNQTGRTNIQQQNYDNKLKKLSGQSGVNTNMAQGYAAQNAANQANRNANTALGFGVADKLGVFGKPTAPAAPQTTTADILKQKPLATTGNGYDFLQS